MEELTFDYAPNSNDQDSGIDCSKSVSLDLSSLQEKKNSAISRINCEGWNSTPC